jgi:hypothetical protein
MSTNQWAVIEAAIKNWSEADKLELARRLLRESHGNGATDSENQREALSRLREQTEKMPVFNPSDGRSNRDHDTLIYG